jgi:hypothetical protein
MSVSLILGKVGVRIKDALVFNQQDLIVLKEYSSSQLANILHHSTLDTGAIPLDFYIQLNNMIELLLILENSVLTLVTIRGMFRLNFLHSILTSFLNSGTVEVNTKVFLHFLQCGCYSPRF